VQCPIYYIAESRDFDGHIAAGTFATVFEAALESFSSDVVRVSAKALSHIKSLTAGNCAGDAYLFGAQKLGLQDLVELFSGINREHERTGYLSPNLKEERHQVVQKMMAYAKANMDPEEFHRFYMAL
jgi:hypothetical protein